MTKEAKPKKKKAKRKKVDKQLAALKRTGRRDGKKHSNAATIAREAKAARKESGGFRPAVAHDPDLKRWARNADPGKQIIRIGLEEPPPPIQRGLLPTAHDYRVGVHARPLGSRHTDPSTY